MIEARQVRYGVRSREILRGVDFRVEEGEFVGLIGPNGSGKSTFLKNVYKVLRPQAGELTLMGDDLLAMSNREMAQRLAVMVQEQEAAFDFTVEEVVMMGRQARKRLLESDSREDRALVGEILARTGLASLREQGFSTLSGGEKQRVLIARALVQDTPCLILDEPTNHLDIQSREWIEEAVEEYEGNLLFVSHDRYFIERFASRIWLLEDGHITDFKGTYEEFQAARARGQFSKAAPAAPVQAAKAPAEKKEKPKRPGGTKMLEKEVAAAERAVGKAEEQMYDLTQQMEEAAADYLKLQELYEQKEALEEEILKLYGRWEELSAQLEEARGEG